MAEHSWMMTRMAFFMRDEFPEADMDKVTAMCIIHDLGEAFTGDIPAFERQRKMKRGRSGFSEIGFPPFRLHMQKRWKLYIMKWRNAAHWKLRFIRP